MLPLKVVDVAPIRGNWLGPGLLFKELAYERAFARSHGSQSKDVVALPPHADAEPHRLYRPWLSNDLRQILEVLSRLKSKLLWVAALV
jgi:hypothetical protein